LTRRGERGSPHSFGSLKIHELNRKSVCNERSNNRIQGREGKTKKRKKDFAEKKKKEEINRNGCAKISRKQRKGGKGGEGERKAASQKQASWTSMVRTGTAPKKKVKGKSLTG